MIRKIIHFPIIQIVLAVILINVITFFVRSIMQSVLSVLPFNNSTFSVIIIFCARFISVFFVYYFFVQLIEKRKPLEIIINKSSVKEFFVGAIVSFSTISIVVLIIWLTGNVSINSTINSAPLLDSFLYHTFFAFLQDIIYFAVIFRIIENRYGSWTAITVASIIFGFKHLLFPGYTIWSVIAQTIEAGILFSSLFILYRKIWAILGFHMIWNFIQYGFFQGFEHEGFIPLLNMKFTVGLISGMPVGLEASIISFTILTSLGIYLLFIVKKRGMLLTSK